MESKYKWKSKETIGNADYHDMLFAEKFHLKYTVTSKIQRPSITFSLAIALVHQAFIISHQLDSSTFLDDLSASSFILLLSILHYTVDSFF